MTHPLEGLTDNAKHLVDALSLTVVVGTLVDKLPALAALLTVVWSVLRIFDWIEARWQGRKPKGDG